MSSCRGWGRFHRPRQRMSFSAATGNIHHEELNNLTFLDDHVYIACYKPALMLCTMNSDDKRNQGQRNNSNTNNNKGHKQVRSTLRDLPGLPWNVAVRHSTDDSSSSWTALHNVGRLDRDSEGLLLLTTDGQFTAQVLSSPTCLKTYWAMVDGGELSTESLQSLRNDGMVIRNSLTRPPASVETFSSSCSEQKISAPHQSTFDHLYPHLPSPVPGMEESRCRPRHTPAVWLQIQLDQGKNRQVRRMTDRVGHSTRRLVRVGIGKLHLQHHLDLVASPQGEGGRGCWKYIDKTDVI